MSDSDSETEEESSTSSRSRQKEEDGDDDEEEEEESNDEETDDESSTTEEETDASPPPKKNIKSKTDTPVVKAVTPKKNSNDGKSNKKKVEKTPAKTSAKKTPSKSPAKKSYIEMAHDAIVALKDRTGSSQPAILKYILANYPDVNKKVVKHRLLLSLKSGVKNQRFMKVRASYKINIAYLKKQAKKKRPKPKKKIKPKKVKPKPKPKPKKLTAAQIAAQKEKERLEAIRKARAERIKKRRFPMEDLALIKEDRELYVSVSLPSRPSLSCVFDPFAPAAAKSDTTGSGLWEDVLHVYHFFRGDIGWGLLTEQLKKQFVVAPFSLKHLISAVEQVVVGNAKRSRMVPPLLTHLFVVALQYLCKDMPKLSVGLSPTSWSEILLLYMDAMERYATTDASLDRNVLPGLCIDTGYLLGVTDAPDEKIYTSPSSTGPLYLQGLLSKAHSKLVVQDPWLFSAEELMILLRALVDDLLGTLSECQEDLDLRQTETYELSKKKRAVDASVRKLQTALQKEAAAAAAAEKEKQEKEEQEDNGDKTEKNDDDGDESSKDDSSEEEEAAAKKPSKNDARSRGSSNGKAKSGVTKQQLETAKKVQQKANDAYEKACRNRLLRTEAIGFDRNFHAVYNFCNDPEAIYVRQRGQMLKLPQSTTWNVPMESRTYKTSWHVMNKKSTFDSYIESLDVRGTRESALKAALHPLRRYLFDDIKELSDKKALLKGKEELQRRLENAKLKCEFGRKSGRLAGKAEEEFGALQLEIDLLQRDIEKGEVEPEPTDLEEVTGLRLLRKFDSQDIYQAQQPRPGRRTTRRDMQKQQKLEAKQQKHEVIPKMSCSKIWPTGNIDGTGIVGLIVSDLLELEEACQRLAAWEDSDRKSWISELETLVHTWHESSPPTLDLESSSIVATTTTKPFTSDTTPDKAGSGAPETKKRRFDGSSTSISSISTTSVSQILSMLKQPLLDLEDRVFEITGLSMAAQDADEADDNMSTSGADEAEAEKEQIQTAWKKIVHRLSRLPAKAHVKIRQHVVEAITAAREAQLATVVAELRSALLLFHPAAAGSCKTAALDLLERYGGYDDDDEDEEEDDGEEEEEATKFNKEEQTETGINSVLCVEAVILNSSLQGQEDASRADWIDAVRKSKTVSKIAALAAAFVQKAKEKLEKLESEHEALLAALEAWVKTAGKRKKASNKSTLSEPSEVWANVRFTEDFCLAKVEDYPWWPAKKCEPKDDELAESLKAVDRTLISLVGESGGLRVVKTEDLMAFSEEIPDEEDLSSHPKELRTQLYQCMTMARRIVRGKNKKAVKAASSKKRKRGRPSQTVSDIEFTEEKKLAT